LDVHPTCPSHPFVTFDFSLHTAANTLEQRTISFSLSSLLFFSLPLYGAQTLIQCVDYHHLLLSSALLKHTLLLSSSWEPEHNCAWKTERECTMEFKVSRALKKSFPIHGSITSVFSFLFVLPSEYYPH
jgi:hypothetical protein